MYFEQYDEFQFQRVELVISKVCHRIRGEAIVFVGIRGDMETLLTMSFARRDSKPMGVALWKCDMFEHSARTYTHVICHSKLLCSHKRQKNDLLDNLKKCILHKLKRQCD